MFRDGRRSNAGRKPNGIGRVVKLTLPEVIWGHIEKDAVNAGSMAQVITDVLIDHYGNEEMQVPASTQNGYAGLRREDGSKVVIALRDGKRTAIKNTCGRDWNWGYGGDGPSQLAGSILEHYFQDEDKADRYRQRFKWEVVADFKNAWEISNAEIELWLSKQAERG